MKILKLPAVMEMTGLSRSSIYEFMKRNDFPKSFKLGERAVGWKEADVVAWVDGRAGICSVNSVAAHQAA